MVAVWQLVRVATLAVLCVGWVGDALAQGAQSSPTAEAKNAAAAKAARKSAGKAQAADPSSAAAPKLDDVAAQKAVEAGIAALDAGKTDSAIQSLSMALSSGSIKSPESARALAHRGVAYRKHGKPALAIADLTSALWLKGGLTDSQRKEALQNRAAAYREAGLPDQSETDSVKAAERATAKQASAAKVIAAPVETAATTPQTAVAAPAPSPAPPQPTKSPGGSGGFFSSLFGGGKSSTPDARPAASATAPLATRSWNETTEVRQSAPAAPSTAKAAPAASAAVAPRGTPKDTVVPTGRYRLQVAAVRTREEAQVVAARMKEKHGADLAQRETVIDETVVGNMGILYRVRVGPFADANEPRALCAKLKGDGLDCLIVAQ